MSIFLPKVAQIEFDAIVKQEYQAKGFKLRGTTRERKDVIGNKVTFRRMSAGIARQKAPQDDVTPINFDYTPIELTLQDWTAPEYSDIFKQAEVNFDEKRELAEAIGKAIGRRMDQMLINALDTSGTTNTIAAAATGFNFLKWRTLNKFMAKNGVKTGEEMYIAMDADGEEDLLDETKLTSMDFIRDQAIANGGLDGLEIGKYTFIVMPDFEGEGGMPVSGSTHSAFAWGKQALGYGIGIDFRTEINYIPEKTSWLVNGLVKANAAAIDPKGIVRIDYQVS